MPAPAWSSSNDGIAAADSSIEGERDCGMVAKTATSATTANAKIIGRIMAGLHFPAIMCRWNRGKVQISWLKPRAGFGERDRGRFLHEIVKNDSRSRGNNAGDKACKNELAHPVPPVSRNYPNTFPNRRFRPANARSPETGFSIREGKCLRFNIHESSPQRADARIKVCRFRLLQIDKEASDPGCEMLLKEITIGAR
jgi:hypothetical protein